VKTYDPKKIDVVLAGQRLNSGLADGTWLTYTSAAPGFSKKVGVDGEVTRTRSHDRSGEIRLTLMASSAINDVLSRLYADDRDGNANGRGVGALLIQDRNGTTLLQASQAWISDDPDISFGAEVETREWVIEVADVQVTHGGLNDTSTA
jgi:hypothetical protein